MTTVSYFQLNPEDIQRAEDNNIPDLYTREIDKASQQARTKANDIEAIWREKKSKLHILESTINRLTIQLNNLYAIKQILGVNATKRIQNLEKHMIEMRTDIKKLTNETEATKPSGY